MLSRNRRGRQLVAVTAAVLASASALAQYRIGGYEYTCPVGVGWNDARCIRREVAPQQQPPTSSVTPPAVRWYDRWGSIYVDGTTGAIGATGLADSKEAAERIALDRCESDGSKHCVKAISFINACGAIGWPEQGQMITSAIDSTEERAAKAAIKECKSGGAAKCAAPVTVCAVPIGVRL